MCIVTAPAGDGLEPLLVGGATSAGEGELLDGEDAGEAAGCELPELVPFLLLPCCAAGEALAAGELPAGADAGDEDDELRDVLLPVLAPPACRSHVRSCTFQHREVHVSLSQPTWSVGIACWSTRVI